jgi:hypothetical protein
MFPGKFLEWRDRRSVQCIELDGDSGVPNGSDVTVVPFAWPRRYDDPLTQQRVYQILGRERTRLGGGDI